MTSRAKRVLLPVVASVAISAVVFAVVLGLHQRGTLEPAELRAYDRLIRISVDPSAKRKVVVVGVTEEDLRDQRVHYPISDADMADLLQKIVDCQPRAVGVDIYRDRPVADPDDPDAHAKLARIWREHPEVTPVFEIGVTDPPPEVDRVKQAGFADFAYDPLDHEVRRGYFTIELPDRHSGQPVPFRSMAYQLTEWSLRKEGRMRTITELGRPPRVYFSVGDTAFPLLRADEGPYVRLGQAQSEYLLDFRVSDHPLIAAGSILEDPFDPALFRDKVVVVGMTAGSVKDYVETPVGRMFGVQLHATAVEQLLRAADGLASPMRTWPAWLNTLGVLVLSLVGGLLAYWICQRFPWRYPSLAVAGVAAASLSGVLLLYWITRLEFRREQWVPLVPATIAFVSSAALVTIYILGHERKSRMVLKRLFSGAVSGEVAEAMWDRQEEVLESGGIKPQELTATVLFTDLKGFSGLSERCGPADVLKWLNELMNDLTDCVDKNHGVVNKYIGDAVMAVFGIPVPRTLPQQIAQDARNAVRCALGMREALRRFNTRDRKDKLPRILMRVGIHTGPLVAGGVGNVRRLEYTVIGPTVNIASRLESYGKEEMPEDIAADGCRILIGQPTLDLLGGEFQTRCLRVDRLHGMNVDTAIHGVIGPAEAPPANKGEPACAVAP